MKLPELLVDGIGPHAIAANGVAQLWVLREGLPPGAIGVGRLGRRPALVSVDVDLHVGPRFEERSGVLVGHLPADAVELAQPRERHERREPGGDLGCEKLHLLEHRAATEGREVDDRRVANRELLQLDVFRKRRQLHDLVVRNLQLAKARDLGERADVGEPVFVDLQMFEVGGSLDARKRGELALVQA